MEREVALTRPRQGIGAAVGLFLVLGGAGFPMGVMAIYYSFAEAQNLAAFIAMSLIGWGVVAGGSYVLRETWRKLRARPVLRVGAGSLAIDDRSALGGSLEVARGDVRAASVELNPHAVWGAAFPLVAADPAAPPEGYLWLAGYDSPLPLVGTGDEPPNLALVFARPLSSRRRRIPALLMRAQDPHAAAAALGSWGVVRPLTPADGDLVLAGLRG
jgi:hypothetical protein